MQPDIDNSTSSKTEKAVLVVAIICFIIATFYVCIRTIRENNEIERRHTKVTQQGSSASTSDTGTKTILLEIQE